MCWTMGMSFTLASSAFIMAIYEWRCFHCKQYSLGIAYWGLMEMLQVFQHIWAAEEKDDYAMCSNTINQFLTELGGVHVVFQPLFNCMIMMSLFRRFDAIARIQADLIYNICLLGALWFCLNPILDIFVRDEEWTVARPTESHPNYDWIQEGYDARLGKSTPNVPGFSCTYYAPTPTHHLAWAIPYYPASYFYPGTSLHCFLMLAPYLAMGYKRHKFFPMAAVLLFFTGPILARTLTPSSNEQPAIWCLYSILQVIGFVWYVRHTKLHTQPIVNTLVIPGIPGQEETLTFVRVMPNGDIYKSSEAVDSVGSVDSEIRKPLVQEKIVEEEKKRDD